MGNVLFVNDFKATNAEAAAPALSSFPRIYWIAGGLPKEGGIDALDGLFSAHCQGLSDRRGRAAVCGDARARRAPYEISGTLAAAVEHAARDAAKTRRASLSCCCRRPARVSTSSRISRSAAMPFAARGDEPCPASGQMGGCTDMVITRGPQRRWRSWWWTIDLYFLGAFLTLMGLGIILSFAASPAVAERIGLDSLSLCRAADPLHDPGAGRA